MQLVYWASCTGTNELCWSCWTAETLPWREEWDFPLLASWTKWAGLMLLASAHKGIRGILITLLILLLPWEIGSRQVDVGKEVPQCTYYLKVFFFFLLNPMECYGVGEVGKFKWHLAFFSTLKMKRKDIRVRNILGQERNLVKKSQKGIG